MMESLFGYLTFQQLPERVCVCVLEFVCVFSRGSEGAETHFFCVCIFLVQPHFVCDCKKKLCSCLFAAPGWLLALSPAS